MPVDFLAAALTLAERGWLAIPLVNDHQGFPKKPIGLGWASLTLSEDTIRSLDWTSAVGLGLVLGPVSGNLAVLDVDDPDLAKLLIPRIETRAVETIRKRGHLYVKERLSSSSQVVTAIWRNRKVKIELKTAGTQVAAPPTPGYRLLNSFFPIHVDSLAPFWAELTHGINDLTTEGLRSGYPKAWRETVPIDERNNSAYVEAHRLREAGMPLGLALRYMEIRWTHDYQRGDQEWAEIERTVESAYRTTNGLGVFTL